MSGTPALKIPVVAPVAFRIDQRILAVASDAENFKQLIPAILNELHAALHAIADHVEGLPASIDVEFFDSAKPECEAS